MNFDTICFQVIAKVTGAHEFDAGGVENLY